MQRHSNLKISTKEKNKDISKVIGVEEGHSAEHMPFFFSKVIQRNA